MRLQETCSARTPKLWTSAIFHPPFRLFAFKKRKIDEKLFAKGITTVLSVDRGVGIMRESKEAHVCSGKGGGGG